MPRPSKGYAFFDVDETLIADKTMLSFQDYWYRKRGATEEKKAFEEEMHDLQRRGVSREGLNRRYYAYFSGRDTSDVDHCAALWFDRLERSRPDLYHSSVVAELRHHQASGRQAVMVSGSFPAVLTHLARRLGVRHLLATTLEVADGRYTGKILAPQTIGAGKALAIKQFLAGNGGHAEMCHAYGDDLSDLPMLEGVGHPTVVRGDPALEAHAKAMGWRILPV